MAPIKRLTHLLGVSAASLLYGIARTAIIGLGVVLLFRIDLSHANWLTALAIFAAATLPLLGLGIFTSILPLLSPEQGVAAGVRRPRVAPADLEPLLPD